MKIFIDTANVEEISDADVDALKAGKEKLMESAQKLFAKVYEQAQGAQGAGPDMGIPFPHAFRRSRTSGRGSRSRCPEKLFC